MHSKTGFGLIITCFPVLLLFTACQQHSGIPKTNQVPENSRSVNIPLPDSLGSISLSIPGRYDTSFTWTHYSDCGKPCDKIKYRFQPSHLKIIKESGFYYNMEQPDAVDQFTVCHSAYFPFHDITDSFFIARHHKNWKLELLQDPQNRNINSDTIEIIGERYFSIMIIDFFDEDKKLYSKKLLAATSTGGNIIEFKFELITTQKNELVFNYLTNVKACLQTISIQDIK